VGVRSAAVIVLVGVALAVGGSVARAHPSNVVQTVTIGGTRYSVIDAVQAAGYIPNPTVHQLDTLVKACPAAHAYGFFASTSEVGFVAWVPRNLLNCWTSTTVGGGPTPNPGCLQTFKTASLYVVFAGTNSRVCPNVSTQVPGGISLSGGGYDGWRIKCYAQNAAGRLLDYVAPSSTLPASKRAGYVLDTSLGGTGVPRAGYPSCFGVRFR
jgi:hypothetical protein